MKNTSTNLLGDIMNYKKKYIVFFLHIASIPSSYLGIDRTWLL